MTQPPESLDAIAQHVQTLVDAETAVVAVAESDGAMVYYASAVGKHRGAIVGKRGATSTSGLCGTAFQGSCPILVAQTQGDSRVRQDHVQALGIQSALAMPLYEGDRLLGALMVLNRQDGLPFDSSAAQLLETYAAEISPQFAALLS